MGETFYFITSSFVTETPGPGPFLSLRGLSKNTVFRMFATSYACVICMCMYPLYTVMILYMCTYTTSLEGRSRLHAHGVRQSPASFHARSAEPPYSHQVTDYFIK